MSAFGRNGYLGSSAVNGPGHFSSFARSKMLIYLEVLTVIVRLDFLASFAMCSKSSLKIFHLVSLVKL